MNQDASTDVRASSSTFTTIKWIALFAVIAATIGGAFSIGAIARSIRSTENAYTGSNVVRVAPEVNGVVDHVYVRTDEQVKAGDPLFDLDPALYDAALRNARAQFDAAANASGTAADSLKAVAATLEEKRVALEAALKTYRDAKDAQGDKDAPSQALTDAEKGWQAALKAFNDAEDAFTKEQDKTLTVTTPTTQLRAAAAGLDKATHDRVKTHAIASASGITSNVTVRPGATVAAGTPLFAIIEGDRWWVDSNFKETDLARIRIGQKATVRLDMYPDTKFDGVVESISSGSGSAFSVLPAENATGNWVKVTQRFPVRIGLVNPPAESDKPLRVGASATVTIDTTQDGK